jgi:hypothetical protein
MPRLATCPAVVSHCTNNVRTFTGHTAAARLLSACLPTRPPITYVTYPCSGKKSLRSLSEFFVSEWTGRPGSFHLVLSPDVRWYPWLHSIAWGPDYSINNTTVSSIG